MKYYKKISVFDPLKISANIILFIKRFSFYVTFAKQQHKEQHNMKVPTLVRHNERLNTDLLFLQFKMSSASTQETHSDVYTVYAYVRILWHY